MDVQDVGAASAPPVVRVTGGRAGAGMLALAPLGYVLVVATMAAVFANAIGISTFADITRTQMDALGAGWAIAHAIVAAAAANVLIGAALVAHAIARRVGGAARVLAWASLALGAVTAVVLLVSLAQDIAMAGFTTPTLGEDPRWSAGAALLPVTFGLPFVQLLLLCAVLWLTRLRPATGLVVGIVCLLAVVVVWFAADSVPPFALGLVACPIGISWLRGIHRARRGLS